MAARKLPSLVSLKGFEACARHLNFSQAAAELHLTQSAISHQIKQLEEAIGSPLFERNAGAMSLTDAGVELLPMARRFFRELTGLQDKCAKEGVRPVTLEIFVHDSFANTWLLPRLGGFTAQWPHVDIKLANEELARFDASHGQVALKIGPESHAWPGLYSEFVLEEQMFPVCSPNLIAALGRPECAADVLKYPLIFRARSMLNGGSSRAPSWEAWLAHHGLPLAPVDRALTVPHSSMAVLAAVRGLGVAMARTSHLSDELDSGKLEKLLPEDLDTHSGYHFLCAPGKEQTPPVDAFLRWLHHEIHRR